MKKIKIYAKNGYFNAENIIQQPYNFIFITGARGTGKTFSSIKFLVEKRKPFIYLRRTQDESDLQASELTSSITKVLNDMHLDFKFGKINKKVGCIYIDEKPLIYTCALSTFASIRGINFDSIQYAIYDEFITEPHVRTFKAEGLALMNFYESVNRNRELEGKKALKLIGLSNSLNIANDIFMQFDLIAPAEALIDHHEEVYTRGGILLIVMQDSPISKMKSETALYLNSGEEYARMAIKNEFILNDFTYVKKLDLRAYVPYCIIGDLTVYKSKSKHEYYCSFSKGQCKKKFTTSIADLERLKRSEWRLYGRYLDGYIRFDSYKAVALFEKYFK